MPLEEQLMEWMKKRLYEQSRSLSLALGILEVRISEKTASIASDGWNLYVNAAWLKNAFLEDSEKLCRLFLHVLCHCMLQHPFLYREQERRQEEGIFRQPGREENGEALSMDAKLSKAEEKWEEEAWELLTEILGNPVSGDQSARWQDDHTLWKRQNFLENARPRANGPGGKEGAGGDDGKKRREQQKENQKEKENQRQFQQKRWEQAKKMACQQAPTSRRRGSRRMSVSRSLTLTQDKRYDYRAFLKQFSSLREEGGLDMEQFDYGFYFWGLSQYENMPLIEPLEYREQKKIEELVIVIDTSGSCSQELVRMFLEETRNILKEEDLFFRRFLLHIIQCDNQIQRDDRITSQEELDRYLVHLQVKGGGGTDFRPAFARIEELRQEELYRLKGVLYFTDGYGIYPSKMPDYQVAFVFLKYRYDDIDVPGWAQKLVLDAERPKGAAYEY